MKMAHVTIRTKNFDEEIRFYKEIAGLEIVTDMMQCADKVSEAI